MQGIMKALVYSTIIAEVFFALMPSGGFKKYIRPAIGVMIVLTVLLSLGNIKEITFADDEKYEEEVSAGKIITDYYEESLRDDR